MKNKIIVVLLWLCASLHAIAKTPGEVDVGSTLRDTHLHGILIADRKLSSFQGKALLINVWASWCGPCQQEIGSVERLARRYGGRQFNVIGISTDDYLDRATAFVMRSNLSFPNFIDNQLILENMLGANRLPLTLLVDAQGRVLYKYYGAREWDRPDALALIAQKLRVKL